MLLSGKKIVVIGASGRIGRELCIRLVHEGAQICASDIDLAPWICHQKDKLSTASNSGHIAFQADSTITKEVQALISYSDNNLAGFDAVINCSYPRAAGLNKAVEDLSFEEFTSNLGVHLGSYFLVSKEFAKYFKARGKGAIVNFSSIYGVITPRFEIYHGTNMVQPITYAAIKAGIVHTSRYLANYLKHTGVRVNCVSPGGILDQQPSSFLEAYAKHSSSKGMLDPSDVLGAVVFLVSDQSEFMTGQNLIIDDGFTL